MLPGNDLLVTGDFLYAGGIPAWKVARWDGVSWNAFGSGPTGGVEDVIVLPGGELVVGGSFGSFNGVGARGIVYWDGAQWSALGTGTYESVYALAYSPALGIVAAGDFPSMGGTPALNVAKWNGTSWSPLSTGIDAGVGPMLRLSDGGLVIGGAFSMVPGTLAAHVAKWDGNAWSALGAGTNGSVSSVVEMPNGDIIVGGSFTTAGGVSATHIARWDGAMWHALGAGLGNASSSDYVGPLVVLANGDLLAGGSFSNAGALTVNSIARWDGQSWHSIGGGVTFGGFYGTVISLVEMTNGLIVAGGQFLAAGGTSASNVAMWNGVSWSPLGQGTNYAVYALTRSPGGGFIAGGWFTTAGGQVVNHVARWDGLAWQPLLPGLPDWVDGLTTLPDGDIVAAGRFTGTVARWDGNSWSPIDGGTLEPAWSLMFDGAHLFAAGNITVAGSNASAFLAELETSCPAGVATSPTTCTGSTGPLALTALGAPWVGSTFETKADGVAPNALVVSLVGFTSPGTPLSAFTPAAGPGCHLLASGEAVALVLPQGGVAGYSIAIPDSSALAGVVLRQQFLQLELGATPLLSSSNGLVVTIGVF
ncbi:MAG: WD40 repeat domain-containing protein [Planctomycetota bacterium]